jgi:hypothetical protein
MFNIFTVTQFSWFDRFYGETPTSYLALEMLQFFSYEQEQSKD